MTGNYSVLQNTSHGDQKMTNKYVWFGALFSISLFIIVGNSIALAVFLRKTFRVKKSNYLLVNLTIADLFVGVSYTILPFMIVTKYRQVFLAGHSEENDAFEIKLLFTTVNASIYTLSVISMERVLAVFWPFHHRLAKRWHYFTTIALVWILSISPVYHNERSSTKDLSWYFFFYTIVTYVALLTIFISYLSIWIKMKFFTKFHNCRTIQENSKLTKTLFIVTVVSLGTWLPRVFMDWVGDIIYELPKTTENNAIFFSLLLLLVSNSFWNVIVYSVRMPEFRRELRQIFCKYL